MMKLLFHIFTYLLIFTFHQSANAAVSYKDFTVGGSALEIQKHCVATEKAFIDYQNDELKCYGIDNLIFQFGIRNTSTNKKDKLNVWYDGDDKPPLFKDGPQRDSAEIGANHQIIRIKVYFPNYNSVWELLENSPLRALKSNLESKYGMDYDFTKNDMQQFESGRKEGIRSSFANGQLLLTLAKLSDFTYTMWLTYSEEEWGRHLMEKFRPKTIDANDF